MNATPIAIAVFLYLGIMIFLAWRSERVSNAKLGRFMETTAIVMFVMIVAAAIWRFAIEPAM